MKRKIRLLALALCLLALFAAHGSLLWRFGKQPPRLEILQIEELPQQAQRQLAPYGLMQQEGLWIIPGEGASLFLANEVTDILAGQGLEGFVVNDRSQALALARQSVKLYLFALALLLLILLVRWLCRDAKQGIAWWKGQLALAYPRQILGQNTETVLLYCLKWTLSLLAMGLLVGLIVSCTFWVPAQWTPPEYILDLRYYVQLKLPEGPCSAYEQLCRQVLPACYGLAGAEVLCSLILAILCTKKKKPERGEG